MFRSFLLISLLLIFLGCKSSTAPISTSESIQREPADTSSKAPTKGWVRLSFDIDEEGNAVNANVIESSNNGYFDKEAIRALVKWKYKPKIESGKPVFQKGLEVKLEFELDEER